MAATVITITSGKGGVGKTTTTVNVGTALAMLGRRVLALDAAHGMCNLDVVLGLESRIVFDLVDVVQGRCDLKQAIIRDRRLPELALLPGSQSHDKGTISTEQMQELLATLRADYDFVLIDSPSGNGEGYQNAVAPADQVVIVTTPDAPAVRDADRIVGMIEAKRSRPAHLVINRLDPALILRGQALSTPDVLKILAVDLIGIVPEDAHVSTSTNRGKPVALNGFTPSGQAFRDIAGRLLGQEIPLETMPRQRNLFKRLARFARN